jgi:hypothetical protein
MSSDVPIEKKFRILVEMWFQATIRTINEKLGTSLRFETLSALPEGGDCCLRRIWREEK